MSADSARVILGCRESKRPCHVMRVRGFRFLSLVHLHLHFSPGAPCHVPRSFLTQVRQPHACFCFAQCRNGQMLSRQKSRLNSWKPLPELLSLPLCLSTLLSRPVRSHNIRPVLAFDGLVSRCHVHFLRTVDEIAPLTESSLCLSSPNRVV